MVFEIIVEQIAGVQKIGRNVATSGQREWKSTSGKRRDVSANSASNIIKSTWTINRGGSENVRTRAQKVEQQRRNQWRRQLLFYFSSFLKDC